MRVKGYGISVIGSRQQNQDSFLVSDEKQLYAVADGVGGGERGDVASLMAVTGVGVHPEEGLLRETFESIQEAILKEAIDSLGEARMGTTLTAVRVLGADMELCHVGDSRCYRYTGGHLQLLTTDHENYDEAYGGPVLCSYLGIPTELFPLQIQEESHVLAPGDRVLLCSDGLYKQVDENELVNSIQTYFSEPETLLRTLCDRATLAPHSDNVTIVYIEVDA